MTNLELEKKVVALEKSLEEAQGVIRRNANELNQVVSMMAKFREEVSVELRKILVSVNDAISKSKTGLSVERI